MKKIEQDKMLTNYCPIKEECHDVIKLDTTLSKDKDFITESMISMVNIQGAIASMTFNMDNYHTTLEDASAILGFTSDNLEKEIKVISSMFINTFVVREKNELFITNVYGLKKNAYYIFLDLLKANKLNSVVKHFFYNRKIFNDTSDFGTYEIQYKNKEKNASEPFLDYLVNAKGIDNPMNLDASGFKMDEIENDRYVQLLAAKVKKLYLLVYPNHNEMYPGISKVLMWYK